MIKFPKLHIAESVLNRIANALDEEGPLGIGSAKPENPQIDSETMIPPNPAVLGMTINNQVREPAAPVAVDPSKEADVESGILESAAMGGSPLDGALMGVSSIR